MDKPALSEGRESISYHSNNVNNSQYHFIVKYLVIIYLVLLKLYVVGINGISFRNTDIEVLPVVVLSQLDISSLMVQKLIPVLVLKGPAHSFLSKDQC